MKEFWLIQRECIRRIVTTGIMYLFMSTILLAAQTLEDNTIKWIIYAGVLAICIYFNVRLMMSAGALHYKAYLSGEVRRNSNLSVKEGKDYKPYQEYRPYKGFLSGFYMALPVAILIIVAAATVGEVTAEDEIGASSIAQAILDMLAGWAIIPFQVLRTTYHLDVSLYWALLLCLIPVVVSGVSYIFGARREKRERERMDERRRKVNEAGKKRQ